MLPFFCCSPVWRAMAAMAKSERTGLTGTRVGQIYIDLHEDSRGEIACEEFESQESLARIVEVYYLYVQMLFGKRDERMLFVAFMFGESHATYASSSGCLQSMELRLWDFDGTEWVILKLPQKFTSMLWIGARPSKSSSNCGMIGRLTFIARHTDSGECRQNRGCIQRWCFWWQ